VFARIDASANEHPNLQVSVMKIFVVSTFHGRTAHRLFCENLRSWGFIKDKWFFHIDY